MSIFPHIQVYIEILSTSGAVSSEHKGQGQSKFTHFMRFICTPPIGIQTIMFTMFTLSMIFVFDKYVIHTEAIK